MDIVISSKGSFVPFEDNPYNRWKKFILRLPYLDSVEGLLEYYKSSYIAGERQYDILTFLKGYLEFLWSRLAGNTGFTPPEYNLANYGKVADV